MTSSPIGHIPSDDQPTSADGGFPSLINQGSCEIHVPTVGERSTSPLTRLTMRSIALVSVENQLTLNGHEQLDNHVKDVVECDEDQPASSMQHPLAIGQASMLADPLLALAADVLDDLERVRIANENRLRQLTRTEADVDGLERGFGLTLDHPDVARLAALVEELKKAEHSATLNLQRVLRKHPMGPWIKSARGVGEKQGARLLAAIGDPYWHDRDHRPRKVSELYAYCGFHVLPVSQKPLDSQYRNADGNPTSTDQDTGNNQMTSVNGSPAGGDTDPKVRDDQRIRVGIAASRIRGQRVNWSPIAKSRAHLVAVSIVKSGGPYREVYDRGREKYANSAHQVLCRRCGPAGHPAEVGSELSAGHQHARALRLVSKAVLRDLWREARRLHNEREQQP